MEKRADRIKREALLKKREKNFKKSIASGVAVSSLFVLSLAQVTGETYGAFSDSEEASDTINACEVFPSTLEKLFNDLIERTSQLTKMEKNVFMKELNPLTFEEVKFSKEADSEAMKSMAENLNETIKSYEKNKEQGKEDYIELEQLWKDIQTELNEISLLLQEIQFNKLYDPNCLEIDNDLLFKQIEDELSAADLIDEKVKKDLIVMFREYKKMKDTAPNTALELSPMMQLSSDHLLSEVKKQEFNDLLKAYKKRDELLTDEIEKAYELQQDLLDKAGAKEQEEAAKKAEEERLKQEEAAKKAEEERLEQEKADKKTEDERLKQEKADKKAEEKRLKDKEAQEREEEKEEQPAEETVTEVEAPKEETPKEEPAITEPAEDSTDEDVSATSFEEEAILEDEV